MTNRIEELAARRQDLVRELLTQARGISWCEDHTDIADQVVAELFGQLGSLGDGIAVIAVGGYGRRELAPHSDIDITIVPEADSSPETDAAVRTFFQGLHEAFGTVLRMEIGYAYRLVSDAAGLDAKTRTGLLDARLIAGSPAVFSSLQAALGETFAPGEFILDKIRERQTMFAKCNDTPLVVEPELKEGAGGIRCFHCANWLRAAIGTDSIPRDEAYDALLRIRNLAQALAGKHADLLSRQRQQQVCEVLHTNPFDLMSEHAANALRVHQHYQRAVDDLQSARFSLSRGCFAVTGEAVVPSDADPGDAAVGVSVATRLRLRIPAGSEIKPVCKVNGASAAFALCQGEATIRNIDRSGLLEQLLPELTACRTLIPNDTVHAFTVFEHSIRVVREIESLDPSSFLGQLRDSLHDNEAIFLAALLHDVGKRTSEADHPQLGAQVAREVGARWGLSPRVTESVAWLIENHLETSHVIRYRDLAEPATAKDFAQLVGDQDRLNMLVLLSYADVRAVGPDIWSHAQDASLRELHDRTSAALGFTIVPAPAARRARLLKELSSEASQDEVQAFVSGLPVHYLNSTPFDLVRVHMGMVAKAQKGQPTIDMVHRADLSATDFTISCLDAPGLLSKILGTFYALDLRVQGIRACTTADVPVALDVFTVNFNGRPVPSATAAETTAALRAVITGEKSMESLVRERGKDPDRTQRVLSYRYIAGLPGILEIRAPRGRGLPFRLSRLVSGYHWNIQSARLGQWADNASAALYLTRPDGSELPASEVEGAMRERETV